MRRLAMLGVLAVACGGVDVNKLRTITSGVYGQTSGGCDTFPCVGGSTSGAPVVLRTLDGGSSGIPGVSADSNGFFEISAAPGSYALCIYGSTTAPTGGDGPCVLAVLDGGLARFDHTSGPGGGNWRPVAVTQ